MKLPALRLKTRFLASGVAIAAIVAVMGAAAVISLESFRKQFDKSLDENLTTDRSIGQLADARDQLREQHLGFKNQLIRGADRAAFDKAGEERKAAEAKVRELLAAVRKAHDELGGSLETLDQLIAAHDTLSAEYEKALGRVDRKRWEASVLEADALMKGKDRPVAQKIAALIQVSHSAAESTRGYLKQEMGTLAAQQRWGLLAGCGIVVVLVGGLFVVLARSVVHQLGGDPTEAATVAHRVAAGDLATEIAVKPGDATSLMAAMAQMQGGLRELVSQLGSSTGELTGTAQSLAATSTQIAGSTTHQSEAASSMAASVEQMTVSIDQLTHHSADALKVARQAGELSAQGNEAVQCTVGEMGGIANSAHELTGIISNLGNHSTQISRIVHVIGEIANQTNLLALNAAIEAARAGEQGRGFSVVADEVRKLAERTTASTEEISSMIGAIQKGTDEAVSYMERWCVQVNAGAEKARDAGSIMERVNGDAARATDAVTEIANALSEQASASTLIAQNVEKIAQMSEENNAAVGAMAENARNLERLADALRGLVARFRLAPGGALAAGD